MTPGSNQTALPQESIYAFVERRAAGASTRVLLVLLGSALLEALILVVISVWLWPLSALGGAAATVALWGLLAHRAEDHPGRAIALLQAALAGLGTLLVAAAALAIFFWLLGPRWVL